MLKHGRTINKRILFLLLAIFTMVATFCALAFSSTTHVSYAQTEDWDVQNGVVISYSGTEKEIAIPTEYLGQPITEIAQSAFKDNLTVEKVTMPDTITKIGQRAFEGCLNLSQITLSSGITKIDDYTFTSCKKLNNINIPSGVKDISTWSFGYCESLETLEFPNGLKSIGPATFYGCKKLNNLVFPDTLTDIGTHSFRACESLSNLTLSKNLKSIPLRAFSGTTSLKELTLYSSIKLIGDESFYGSGIKSINIPSSVQSIGAKAFYDCKFLIDVSLVEGLTSIGESAFFGCSRLQRIQIPNGITTIEKDTFNGCAKLISISIPSTLTSVDNRAFTGCSKLVEVYNLSTTVLNKGEETFGGIAKNAKVIHTQKESPSFVIATSGGFVFYNDGSVRATFIDYNGEQTEIVLPKDINGKAYDIGENAFYAEKNLEKITLPECIKRIEKNAFNSCKSTIKIYFAGSWGKWQNVYIDKGNDFLYTISFLSPDTSSPDYKEEVEEYNGSPFFDKIEAVFKDFMGIIVSNLFVVNFILVLIWGVILIYNGNAEKNKKTFVIIVCVQWILISGLRADSVGADTGNYMNIFDYHSSMSWTRVFSEIKNYFIGATSTDAYSGLEPLFVLFNKLVSVFTTNHVLYKFIVAIIFTVALGKYIYKYSTDPCLSFAIYGSLFYNMFSLTGYRQVLAVALILYGYKFIRERKLIPFLVLVLISSLFHKTSLMFILLYVLANKKLKPMYLLFIAMMFAVMLIFNNRIFNIVKNIFGYDEYAGNYGFKQLTFTILYSALTIVAFWKYKDVVKEDPSALQLYNGLLLSWIMFPFVLESPSALRLVYNFGFVILPLVPKILKTFNEGNERQIVYLAIYALFGVQILLSGFAYSFFWM